MLTIKQITEDTDKVIRGLEKKHFANAKETIAQVIELNDKRRNAQNQLDRNLAEVNSISKNIGLLMKEGKKGEAETAKARVLLKICRTCCILFLMFLTMKYLKVLVLKTMKL